MPEFSSQPSVVLPQWVGRQAFTRRFEISGPGPHPESRNSGLAKASAILFDGFLYDREHLARRLEVPASVGETIDLIAAAWARWGVGMLDHLDGSFVVAVWDDASRRGIIAHDALGHHPLFYAQDRDALWFATNVLALASRTDRQQPDRVSLAMTLMLESPPRARTGFAGVSRLEAGCYLEVGPEGVVGSNRYWQPVPADSEEYLPAADVLESFEEQLKGAVDRRLQLQPDGIMLSGGLDSVCIAAFADEIARQRGLKPLAAFSGRHHPDDPPSYEEEMQDRVVERLGLRHFKSNLVDWIGPIDLVSASLEEIRGFPHPSLAFWTGGYMGFARWAARRGHRIFLTGSGGDEWLTAEPSYAADLVRHLSFGRLRDMVAAESSGLDQRRGRVLRQLAWTQGLRKLLIASAQAWTPRTMDSLARRRVARSIPRGLVPEEQIAADLLDALMVRRLPPLGEGIPRSLYRRRMRAIWEDSTLLHEQEVSYHAQRLTQVVFLAPYHDRRLVEFLSSVPPFVLFPDRRYKGMVRSLADQRLPGLGLAEQRKTYPREVRAVADQLRNHLSPAFARVGCRRLADLGLVEPGLLQARFEHAATSSYRDQVALFAALSTETWLASNCE